jgi:hypothetical protein
VKLLDAKRIEKGLLMKKINWGRTIFVALFTGIIIGLLCRSYLMGSIIAFSNFVGGIIYGLVFGERKNLTT